jgi:putative SOS response-associated peptidase YedK
MCGRYSLAHTRQEIEDLFEVSIPAEYAPRYNIAPTQPVLIVRENPHTRNGLEAVHVVWGLIPPWADDPRIGSKMINARCETAAEKPSFRHALRRRRCVVPVSGFYEWQAVAGGRKQPYFIKAADGKPLALGGMWEMWDGPNGEQIESCTILTTCANDMLKSMHDRMPVILPIDRTPMWLDTRNEDVRTLGSFLAPATPDALTMYPVSPLVNSVRNDSKELLEPLGLF